MPDRILRLLLIDCYDSFTYNLLHMLEANDGCTVSVCRADQCTPTDFDEIDGFVFSPGPGLPDEVEGLSQCLAYAKAKNRPILGVCLGHQALALSMGAKLKQLSHPFHGLAHSIKQVGQSEIFKGLPLKIVVGRYHSWVVDSSTLTDCWIITAKDSYGDILAIQHQDEPWYGIQFHPESVLSPLGSMILANFIRVCHGHTAG